MKHDELVKRLRSGCDSNTAFLLCYKAADALVALQTDLAAARALLHHVLDRNVPRAQLYPHIRAALAAPEERT